jgi:hypothetical protein
MATNVDNILIAGLKGSIGKQLVLKKYGSKLVVSKYPDRSKVVLSKKQKTDNKKFTNAVAFARQIINDPIEKSKWQKKIPKDKSVYQQAIKWYMENNQA